MYVHFPSANRRGRRVFTPPSESLGKGKTMLGVKEKKAAPDTLGIGGPNAKVDGEVNSLYLDTANALLWIKELEGKKTGWRCLGHIVPDDIQGASSRL